MPTLMDTKTTGRDLEAKRARLAELEAEATTLGDSTQAAASAGNVEEYVRLMARQAANPQEATALQAEITQLRREQIAERIAELNGQQPLVRREYEVAYRDGEQAKLDVDRRVDHAYTACRAIDEELTRLTQESHELAAVLAVS